MIKIKSLISRKKKNVPATKTTTEQLVKSVVNTTKKENLRKCARCGEATTNSYCPVCGYPC
ncbi:MAG: hypothetical protein WCI93_03155 [bacterium]